MYTRLGRVFLLVLLLGSLTCAERRPLEPVLEETLAHEPWEDEEAENLAWLISGEAYAPRDVYDRVRADLAQIRERWGDLIPGLLTIEHWPWSAPQIWLRMGGGDDEYHAWDSLNAFYRAQIDLNHGVFVRSSNRVNTWRMMQSYEKLPEVRYVESNAYAGDRPNLYAFLHPWGIAYLLRRASGDCQVGCIWSHLHYFRSKSAGIEYVGDWELDGSDPNPPGWWIEAKKSWDLYELGDAEWRFRDATPPSRVTDLRLAGEQRGRSVDITFTATGDDGDVGLPAFYEISWQPEPINEANWGTPHPPWGEPPVSRFSAGPVGEKIVLKLTRLRADTVNYIGLITFDRPPAPYQGTWKRSPISNTIVSRNLSGAAPGN